MANLPENDWELLAAYARDGSHEAFARLAGKYADFVFATALRQIRDHALAEDVTQAVFIVLARRARSLRAGGSLAAWLHQTTLFAAANAQRAESRRRKRERAAMDDMPTSTSIPTQDQNEMFAVVDQALSRLRRTDRDALALHYLQGLSVPETAAALHASTEATKKRLGRALERLRDRLRRSGVAVPAAADVLQNLADIRHLRSTSAPIVPGGTDGNAFFIARGVIHMMWRTLFIKAAASLAVVAIAVTTATIAVSQPRHRDAAAQTTAPVPPAAMAPQIALGPIIERTLVGNAGGQSALDLDTNKLHIGNPPDRASAQPMKQFNEWLVSTGIDVVAEINNPSKGLLGFNVAAVAATPQDWDVDGASLHRALSGVKAKMPAVIDGGGVLPRTYFVRTREGGEGVLQILGFEQTPPAVRIRYRMVPSLTPVASSRPAGSGKVRLELSTIEANMPATQPAAPFPADTRQRSSITTIAAPGGEFFASAEVAEIHLVFKGTLAADRGDGRYRIHLDYNETGGGQFASVMGVDTSVSLRAGESQTVGGIGTPGQRPARQFILTLRDADN